MIDRGRTWMETLLVAALLLLTRVDAQCDEWSPGGVTAADWKCIPSSPGANPPDCSDTAPNTLTVMADEAQKIAASGTLTSWDYSANVAGKTTLMIWRPGPTPTGFILVCTTEVTAPAPGLQHTTPDPTAPPCLVQEGDFFGMWQGGAGVVGIRWASFEADGEKQGSLAKASQAPGITNEPEVGKSFTIQKVGAPRSYAVTITICGAAWGWMTVGVVLIGGGAYVAGGVMLGGRTGRHGGGGSALAAHPHHEQWLAIQGLVEDGVRFSQGFLGGSSHSHAAAGGGYARAGDGGGGGAKDKRRHGSKRERG